MHGVRGSCAALPRRSRPRRVVRTVPQAQAKGAPQDATKTKHQKTPLGRGASHARRPWSGSTHWSRICEFLISWFSRRATPMCDSGESKAASVGVRMISAPSAFSTSTFISDEAKTEKGQGEATTWGTPTSDECPKSEAYGMQDQESIGSNLSPRPSRPPESGRRPQVQRGVRAWYMLSLIHI